MLLSLAIKCAPYQLVRYTVSVSFVKRHLIDFVCDLKCGSFLYFKFLYYKKGTAPGMLRWPIESITPIHEGILSFTVIA